MTASGWCPAAGSPEPACATGMRTQMSPAPKRCWRGRRPAPWPATKPSGRGISATRARTVWYRRAGRPPGIGWSESPRRSARPTRRCSSPSACTWKTWKKTANSGRGKPPRHAISSRCTVTPSTPIGRRVPTDEHLLPFLAHVTRWLGEGRDVLFSEFGLPTYRRGDPSGERARRQSLSPLIEEQAAAAYTERALVALHRAGCAGAMLWCYTDYDSAIWEKPPLDLAVHERSFGLWRADGSPKPSVAAVAAFAGAVRVESPDDYKWIDIEPDEFSLDPRTAPPPSLPSVSEERRDIGRAPRHAPGIPRSA